MAMMHNLQKKMPRYHPGLLWESRILTNDFVDISRIALDDRYGKTSAPLSKRRNGPGFTNGSIPGLFGGFGGYSEYSLERQAYIKGGIVTVLTYLAIDGIMLGSSRSPIQKRFIRALPVLLVGTYAWYAIAPPK
jgi:hypothetical protein